jgi:monoterpene epsilon-lactone hydrolase
MTFPKLLLLACATVAGVSGIALAHDAALAPRQVPAKTLPVPDDVSPELQKLIAVKSPNFSTSTSAP